MRAAAAAARLSKSCSAWKLNEVPNSFCLAYSRLELLKPAMRLLLWLTMLQTQPLGSKRPMQAAATAAEGLRLSSKRPVPPAAAAAEGPGTPAQLSPVGKSNAAQRGMPPQQKAARDAAGGNADSAAPSALRHEYMGLVRAVMHTPFMSCLPFCESQGASPVFLSPYAVHCWMTCSVSLRTV
jgi:hypothetical protein